jgi:PAS domain S-box-containing protein
MLATLLDEIPFPAAILNWPEGQPIKIASANPIFLNGGRDLSGLFEPAELQATCEELIRQAESADGNNYPSWKGPAPCKHHSGWEAGIKYLGKNETDTQVFLLTYKAPANTIFEPDYGQLLCQTHDLCAMCDREGQFQFISPAITTELGYKPEDLIGQVAFDFVYPDDLPRTREAFDRLQKELSVQIPPYRFRKKNGEWCWLQTMCTNIGALENSGGILVNATDITGLIEAQQNLKERNERYQLIYKAGKDALYDWDILNDQLTGAMDSSAYSDTKPTIIKPILPTKPASHIQQTLIRTAGDGMNSWPTIRNIAGPMNTASCGPMANMYMWKKRVI